MYRGYRIVVNTAAGRRRYMQYIVPIILASEVVDRYDIWVNTYNGADIAFFRKLAEKYSKVNLVWQPDGVVDGIKSINAFYKTCVEEDAIYFKIDDDLLWIEPDGIKKMVDFRIDNPDYFLVSPLVINNALSTYLLQMRGKIKLNRYYNSNANSPTLWESPVFASELHEWFMANYLSTSQWSELHVGSQPMGMARFSINAVLWFGKEMAKFKGIIPGDDEEFLSCKYPTEIGACNCWNGNVIAAHFAFFTQRAYLDSGGILERYGNIIHNLWKGSNVEPYDVVVQKIIREIDANERNLISDSSPYIIPPKTKPTAKERIVLLLSRYCPGILHLISAIRNNKRAEKIIQQQL